MVLKEQKTFKDLIALHSETINVLKEKVESNYPDLKLSNVLNDGTVMDDLFYLRYILSSKDDLSSVNAIEDSKTLQNIFYSIRIRNTTLASTSKDNILSSILPIKKTGELRNGTPILFLPLKEVNFEALTRSSHVEKKAMESLLRIRSDIFNELDEKTRSTGRIVKSITIYDLNGISFGDIYKLKGFFKLVQNQGKEFKKLFPQCTEMTIFINVTASYLLKSLMTSSKQKIMTQKEMLKKLECQDAVPETIGGCVKWSIDQKVDEMKPTEKLFEDDYFSGNEHKEPERSSKNEITELTQLEKEMVLLKKNKIFSINVLRSKQTVNLYFTNFKQKEANVLILTKQKDVTSRKKVTLPKGFSTFPLQMTSKGDIMIVYLDTKKSEKFVKNDSVAIEDVNLKRSAIRKLLRNGRKKFKKMKGTEERDTIEVLRQQHQLLQNGIKSKDKVLFRFEVSDFILCGSESSLSDSDLESLVSYNDQEKPGLVEFDALSLTSKDSVDLNREGNFVGTAAQILTNGLFGR